jgi:hypothetical protein
VSSEMLRRVALVRTDVSEELSASFIRVTRIGELGTTPAVTSNQCMHAILHSHHRENLKSYKFITKSSSITYAYGNAGNYRVAAQVVASRAVLSSTELVSLVSYVLELQVLH